MGGWDMVRGGRDGGRGVWSEGGMGEEGIGEEVLVGGGMG